MVCIYALDKMLTCFLVGVGFDPSISGPVIDDILGRAASVNCISRDGQRCHYPSKARIWNEGQDVQLLL